jgi:O-antigen biosynthesis protein
MKWLGIGHLRLIVEVWRSEGWRTLPRLVRWLGRELARSTFGHYGGEFGGSQFFVKLLELGDFLQDDIDRVNAAAATATEDWLLLVPVAGSITSDAITAFAEIVRTRPDVDIAYADQERAFQAGSQMSPWLKPDFDPELLLAYNYIGFPALIRREAFATLGGLRARFGSGADHDLWLRAFAAGFAFGRVPRILLHAPQSRNATAQLYGDSALTVVSAYCQEVRPDLLAAKGIAPQTVQVRRRFSDYPSVTVVIPTCQKPGPDPKNEHRGATEPHIVGLLKSLCCSTWPKQRLNVLVADDREDGAAYALEDWPFVLRRMVTKRRPGESFNYARKMNVAWRQAETDAIVLMNDDIRIKSPDWLEALLTFSLDDDVGGVGARLLFPDGRLQHAGIAGGPFGTAVHAWYGEPSTSETYGEWARVHKDWSMVTGAVFATRKSVLGRVGGFDEQFALEFNDLDLCLRIRLLGYRIVYTPFAELVHYERASRGPGDTPPHELSRFRRRWHDMIVNDPAFHPRFSRSGYVVRPG